MNEKESKKLVGVELLIQTMKKQSDQLTKQINQIMEHNRRSTSGAFKLYYGKEDGVIQKLIKEFKLLEANISPYKTLNPTKEMPEISTNISLLERTLDKEKSESHESSEIIFLLNNLNKDVQEIKAQINEITQDEEKQSIKKRGQRGPNVTTVDKIRRLAKYRNESIRDRGTIPIWSSSCNHLQIDRKTVRKYAPELHKKWDDKDYKWDDNF